LQLITPLPTSPVLTTPTQLTQLDFLFWYLISFFRWLGGGKSKSLKKIYRPRAIFKKFDPPWFFLYHPSRLYFVNE